MKKKLSEAIINNQIVIIVFVIYVFGLIAGSVCYNSIDSESVKAVTDELLSFKQKTFTQQLVNDLCLNMTMYFLTFIFGLCCIGLPAVSLMPFLIGIINSVKISYFYLNYGTKGIGYTLLMILPGASMFVAVSVLSACDGIDMSRVLFKAAFRGGSFDKSLAFQYLKEFSFFGIATIVISVLNALLTTSLSSIIAL